MARAKASSKARSAAIARERRALMERCRNELDGTIDDLGLAAVFESWGITDASAASRYGAIDVFDLATEILGSSEMEFTEREVAVDSTGPVLEMAWIMRAATYLPPTVFVAIALSSTAVPAPGAVFAVITCVGWGIAEAVSRVAYSSTNRGGPGAMRDVNIRVLRSGTLCVTLIALAVGWLAGSVGAALLIGAQLQYLLLSIVLLPMERETLLLWWIVPAMLGSAIFMTDLDYVWIVLMVAVVGELAATVHTLLILRRIRPTFYGAPRRRDFSDAIPFLASGAAMGGFVLSTTAVVLVMLGSKKVLLVMVVPLMLSMGLAEIGIRLFQSTVLRELGESTSIGQFSRRVRLSVIWFCTAYVALLVAVDVVVASLVGVDMAPGRPAGYAMFGLVGLCLFLTLILMALDHVLPVLATFVCGTVVVGGSVLLWGATATVVTFGMLFSVLAAVFLLSASLMVVGHPANHMFV